MAEKKRVVCARLKICQRKFGRVKKALDLGGINEAIHF